MTDTSSVYIFKTWEATPVYHDYGRIAEISGGRGTGDVTKCGLVMYDGNIQYRATLRRDHADSFARPCGKCFPSSGPGEDRG